MRISIREWHVAAFVVLWSTSAPVAAAPLDGMGPHLPIPVPNPGDPVRVAPDYSGAPSLLGTWSLPAHPDWHGSFGYTGLPPGTSGPGPASFDFTSLDHGVLPVGTIFSLGDLDAGSGPNEVITLIAFDSVGVPLDTWLEELFAVYNSLTPPDPPDPMDTPMWEWTGDHYRFDGSTVPGNPSAVVHMKSNKPIYTLMVNRESAGFGYAISAPLASVTSIPTLSEWGMSMLALLLLVVGTISIQRHRLRLAKRDH